MAGTRKGPWCLGISVASPSDNFRHDLTTRARFVVLPTQSAKRTFCKPYLMPIMREVTMSAARLQFRCSPMRVLTCLHTIALCHSFWCSSASHLLIFSVTDLFEIPITGSRPVRFSLAASLASLSAISLPLIPLCPGIQRTVTWLSSASFFNASKHSQSSIEMVTDLSNVMTAALLSEQMRMFLPWPWSCALRAHWSMAAISVCRTMEWGPKGTVRLMSLFFT